MTVKLKLPKFIYDIVLNEYISRTTGYYQTNELPISGFKSLTYHSQYGSFEIENTPEHKFFEPKYKTEFNCDYIPPVIDKPKQEGYNFKEDEIISSTEIGDEQWILIKKKSSDKLPESCLKKQKEKQSKRKKKELKQEENTYFPIGS